MPAEYETVETQIKRDRWGRYLIPDPETGQERSWTRATTIANTNADRYGLEQWSKRNVILGIAARPDLYARAASLRAEDKSDLNQIAKEAEDAAASKAGANLGTALHRFTERLDRGETVVAPEPWDADLKAYETAMAAHEVLVLPEWIERVLLVPELGVAGTCDRVLWHLSMWPYCRIGDLKTGKDVVRYGMGEIAVQLAIYAHASCWFDTTSGALNPVEETIDRDVAVVIHLPVGQARCDLYTVDIKAGWEAALLAHDVRAWRQRKDLAEVMVPAAPQRRPERFDWLADRVERIKGAGVASTLAQRWSLHPDIPTFKRGGPRTEAEMDIVAGLCELVEMEHGLPFGISDPTLPAVTRATLKEKQRHA